MHWFCFCYVFSSMWAKIVTRVEGTFHVINLRHITKRGFVFLLSAIKAKFNLAWTRRIAQIRLFNFESSFSPVKTKDTQGTCSKVFFLLLYFVSFVSSRMSDPRLDHIRNNEEEEEEGEKKLSKCHKFTFESK